MPRVISLILLLAILLLIGSMFFQVVMQFAVPLFLAAVLVVVFDPVHQRIRREFPNRRRLCALLTTLLILLIVLAPMAWLGWNAYLEGVRVVHDLKQGQAQKAQLDAASAAVGGEPPAVPTAPESDGDSATSTSEAASAVDAVQDQQTAARNAAMPVENVLTRPLKALKERYSKLTGGLELQTDGLVEKAAAYIGNTLVSSVQALLSIALGLAIMILALYYFLADGPAMIGAAMRLSPLDDKYEQELLDKFANVSRAVVVASLLSAVAQGLLAGIGYYFALPSGAPILFLLTMLTMALAIVPFIGAAAVWVPTAAWIYLSQGVGDAADPGATTRAILLAVYCVGVVSTIDNFIKPYVLHGQSNMHPLLALISVLGGVQVLGPVGIIVGPMLVAFVQAILNMLNKEIKILNEQSAPGGMAGASAAIAIHPAARLEAESIAAANASPLATPTPTPSAARESDAAVAKRRRKRK